MDGMLSQDEINALLSGIDLSDPGSIAQVAAQADATMLSTPTPEPFISNSIALDGEEQLTDVERDAIGEVANISMGSSATTLYSLVNRKVNITTPIVTQATWHTVLQEYEKPCVFILIKYTAGLDGSNILVLKEKDVKIITDLMMGGDGTNVDGELGELHLSAISEAMNQMMGSSATSLSTMLGTMIDISPPEASLIDLTSIKSGEDIAPFLGGNFVKIAFRMQIDELVDSTIMQLYPVDFARKLVDTFVTSQMGTMQSEPDNEKQPSNNTYNSSVAPGNAAYQDQGMNGVKQMQMDPNSQQMGMQGVPQSGMPQMGMPQMGMPNMNMPQMGMPQGGMYQGNMGMNPNMMYSNGMYPNGMGMPQGNMEQMNIQPAQFQNFTNDFSVGNGQENIGLIRDVPLEVTVELGRTTKSIAEILDFAPGTIIELDRIAGEPIDVLVNGKFVAKGEVVVIEESFGIRVTEIIK